MCKPDQPLRFGEYGERDQDCQFEQALALAKHAESLNKTKKSKRSPKTTKRSPRAFLSRSASRSSDVRNSSEHLGERIQGMGSSISPTGESRTSLRASFKQRISGTGAALRSRKEKISQKGAALRSSFSKVRRSQIVPPLDALDDELAEIRQMRGKERLVKFLETYDPAAVTSADQMLQFGGTSEVEMWEALKVKYQVNQRRRLWQATTIASPHVDADSLLKECANKDEVEKVIAQYTKIAMQTVEKREIAEAQKEMTWNKGKKNSYQQVPELELGD